MIINIRGTSGSGKSTLMRAIMALYDKREAVHAPDRKQPLYYVCTKEGHKPLTVLGHYETDCGGCDTISGLDLIFELAARQAQEGDVLFEGLLVSAEVARTIKLFKEHEGAVVHIDIPLQQCLDSVNGRRFAKAERNGKPQPSPVNPVNTESKWKGTRRSVERLREAGIYCFQGDRDGCQTTVRHFLSI